MSPCLIFLFTFAMFICVILVNKTSHLITFIGVI